MIALAEQLEKESDVLLDKVRQALLKYTHKKSFNIVTSDYTLSMIDTEDDDEFISEIESVSNGVIYLESGTEVSIAHHQDINILIGIFSTISKIKPNKA